MLYDLKLIEGTTDYYVSRCGDVYSKASGKFKKMKPGKNAEGYLLVVLAYIQADGTIVRKTKRVHRLVAEAFIPNPNNYPIIDHKNNDKTDNRAENLQWCTNKFNIQKAHNDGLCEALKKPIKVIFNDNTEKVFNSLIECAKYLKVDKGNLSKYIQGKQKIPKRCNVKEIYYLVFK